jgi:hypothetical protein
MKTIATSIIVAFLLCYFLSVDIWAWELDEHEWLCDSAYVSVMGMCGTRLGDSAYVLTLDGAALLMRDNIFDTGSFGQICAKYAEDDLALNRFHERRKSISEQLRNLRAGQINTAWYRLLGAIVRSEAVGVDHRLHFHDFSAGNVVEGYLLHHLMALRLAERAGQSRSGIQIRLRQALDMEAVAQGYLADAFSAGHILVPVSDKLASIHPRNTKEAYNYHRDQGVYVINSRGDAWQTFGDRLLRWYGPTNKPVLEACRTSLMELMAMFYVTGKNPIPPKLESWIDSIASGKPHHQLILPWLEDYNGDEYYARFRLPTLLLLPMPVSATWSFRTQVVDENGMRKRFHYPQLDDSGFHDPDLQNIDQKFLYKYSAMPQWLIPEPFRKISPVHPDTLIKSDPDWASVRWIQNRSPSASYKGLLIHIGGHALYNNDNGQLRSIIGLGYGLWDDLILIRNVSVDFSILPTATVPKRKLVIPSFGFGLPIPGINLLKAARFDLGVALDREEEYNDYGGMLSIGVDSQPIPLQFSNLGVTCRLRYQWIDIGETIQGPAFEFILQ